MQANEKIGPYRLIEPLGSGGMGTVCRAWDERLKRPVALKRILPTGAQNPKLLERFRREAEAVARLNHPAIVHIYDIVETEDGDWIVMELVNGRTLQALLREGPLEPQCAARLGREIAEGLAEAHAQGFIHRDLKAPNVMVTSAGRAKILDFGVAKQIQPEAQETTLSAPGLVIGTSYAMSPEQAMGLPLDARSDLFSLGSLLYEMVTGVAPFRAETAQATLARVCSFRQRPASALRPDVPQELSNLIDRLLEKDPVDRPTSAVEVAESLGDLAGTRAPRSQAAAGSRLSLQEEETVREGPPFIAFISKVSEPPPATPPSSGSLSGTGARATPAKVRHVAWWSSLVLLLAIVAIFPLAKNAAPSDPYVLYQEGQAYLRRYDKKGNLDKAIESFQRILAQDNQHAAAHAALAKAYCMKHLGESKDPMWLDQALSMARRAVALDEHLAMAWVSIGLVDYSRGRLGEAERAFKQALHLEPLNSDAYYGLGRVYESQKKVQDAESAHRKAIEIRPDRMYYDELGSLYYRTGRAREAIHTFQKSIELTPDSFYGYRNLSVVYYGQGDLAEAAAQLQKALQIQPDSTLYGNLGTIYFSQGFYPEAVEAFEKALELPGGANSDVQWGNLGDACRWTPGKEERAREAYLLGIQVIREKLGANPDDVTLRSRLALYLAKRGDRDEALAELRNLEKTAGKDASAWYRMVVAYEAAGSRKEALAALENALREGLSFENIKSDPELLGLRADRRYHEAIATFNAS
ncbi:MAG TPA: protein kinase [Thermoanaerobaculia bacterium]